MGLITAVIGVKDVVVVSTQDVVLVLGRDQGDKVKQIVETLRESPRREAPEHTNGSIGRGAIINRSVTARAIRSSAS
jgi:hypothetical protein